MHYSKISAIALSLLGAFSAQAGNPDRQGEAGAYELLINPWARSAGLNGLVCSSVMGVEAMNYNPAGLGRNRNTEVAVNHMQYLVGTGLSLSAAGMAQKIGNNGSIGLTINALSFGQIDLTTTSQPEGIGTFSPTFFNIGLGYGHVFRDDEGREKIYVGAAFRVVSESIANASATGVCFDAGIQYTTGKHRQLKFGLALRNVGSKMKFKGDGLSFVGVAPNQTTAMAVEHRPAGFEMPSLLHLGASYDFLFPKPSDPVEEDAAADEEVTEEKTDKKAPKTTRVIAKNRLTAMFNFTANSFSRDQVGIGLEYAFREMVMLRVAYKYEGAMYDPTFGSVSSGLTAGFGVHIPFKKGGDQRLHIDYAFEYTRFFKGSHSVGLKVAL